MRRGFSQPREVTAFSAVARGDTVVVSLEGPDVRRDVGLGPDGSAHLVVTLRGGAITHLRSCLTRDEALAI